MKEPPCPTDPNFQVPDPGEEAFRNPKGEEDDQLLATGAWDDQDQDAPHPTKDRARRVIVHRHRN